MSGSTKQIPHTTVESIIFHKSNLLTAFGSVTLRHGPVIIQTVFHNQPLHVMRGGFLGTFVKAEIVSPYSRILINTGVGNPTAFVNMTPRF